MKLNAEVRENVRLAYAILVGIPPQKYVHDLNSFYRDDNRGDVWDSQPRRITCGTLACGAGWLALHPMFKKYMDENSDWVRWMTERFGSGAPLGLFCSTGVGDFDQDVDINALSEKQLLLYRFRRYLGQGRRKALAGAKADAS